MESSIAVFLWRQPACERLPTSSAAASLPTIWVGLLRPSACCAFPPEGAGSVKHTFVIFFKLLKPFSPWSTVFVVRSQLSGSSLRRLLRFRRRFPATRLRKQQATSNKRPSNARQAMAGKGRAASESPNRVN